ncbi:response regulator [Nocardioides sp. NPDC057772]|uniref:response regulator n=1 Tax=Nocardioides sp. NPDC057772 TaxID=3346245 RepID=UPI00366BD266
MTRILIVEDELQFARALRINLRARKYDVDIAGTAAEALDLAARNNPDLVLLDLSLPDLDGLDVIRGLRGWSDMPVVVLSARDGQWDKVDALDAGADDYVTKPFGMDELLARIRAALRRSVNPPSPAVVETTSFRVDLAAKKAIGPNGNDVRLTPTEWHILEVLLRNRGQLVTQRLLLTEVWGPEYEKETQYLRVYLGQLRRKLEADPTRPRHLVTEPGIGYRFEP